MEEVKNNKVWVKGGIIIALIILVAIGSFLITNRKIFDMEFNNDSKIESVRDNQIKNLNKLCKVWGFAKYHHPKVVAGKVMYSLNQ